MLDRRFFIATSAAALATSVRAQSAWPQRAVKLIIPFGPGAGADIGARMLSDKLAQRWGKPVVVENRPGGDGMLAVNAFLGAGDDHVLMFAGVGSFTVHPHQVANLPYVFERDFLPVARISSVALAIGVPASGGVKTLRELVARAKANPGKLNGAQVPGITELIWDGFTKTEGLDIVKVPYKDYNPATGDLAEGRLDAMFASYAALQAVHASGRVNILCVTTKTRAPMLPDIPTPAEAGSTSLEVDGLIGVFGPKTLSQESRNRIGADIVAAASADPTFAQRLATTGQIFLPAGALEFQASVREQMEKVAQVAKLIGMSPR